MSKNSETPEVFQELFIIYDFVYKDGATKRFEYFYPDIRKDH